METGTQSAYWVDYYKNNKDKYQKHHKDWMENNRLHWNQYQNRYKRIKYWTDKLEKNPDDVKAKQKLKDLIDGK